MKFILNQLKKLTSIDSPSGFTGEVTRYTMEEFRKLGFQPYLTNKGCVVCDLEQYYKSWEKLVAAGALRIFPAHGRPFSSDRLIENLWRNRERDVVRASTGSLSPAHSLSGKRL